MEEVQDYATQWLWFFNHERPHKANGGKPPLRAAWLLLLTAVKNGGITVKNQVNFSQKRYLKGLPYDLPNLALVLRSGNQFQRRAAAMAIALLNPQARVPNIKSKTSAID